MRAVRVLQLGQAWASSRRYAALLDGLDGDAQRQLASVAEQPREPVADRAGACSPRHARIKRSSIVKPSQRPRLLSRASPSCSRPVTATPLVREVTAMVADRQRWWQRVEELLTVAAAVPVLAVILRWARRRRAARRVTARLVSDRCCAAS